MKFWDRFRSETPEEFHNRMARLQQTISELDRKTPEEVAGTPHELGYYSRKLSQAMVPGQEAEVRQHIHTLLTKFPNDFFARMLAAMAYRSLGEPAEEIAQLGIALAVDPQNCAVSAALAIALQRRGEQETAAKVREGDSIYRKKRLVKFWGRYRSQTREETATHQEQMQQLERILDEVDILIPGREEETRQHIEVVLRQFPNEPIARMRAARCYRFLGEESEGLAQIGIALALDPEKSSVYHLLAYPLLRRGERETAKKVLENGWSKARKYILRQEQEAGRANYFRILNQF